jgi:hypothetical protein
MTADADPLKRLGDYVERRIAELALEYAAVCRAGGFSDETLGKIRKGSIRARSTTYRKLQLALRWAPGSVEAILSGGEPTPIEPQAAEQQPQRPQAPELPESPADPGLSPSEALRRVVRSSARELGVPPNGVDEVMRLVRQDLAGAEPSAMAPGVRTDLSDLVRARRLDVKLTLDEVAARTADPESGKRLIEADWLERLEMATLTPDEHPQYPQLDALVDVLHLDPGQVQEAAGAQFMGIHTVWSDDGQVRALVQGELSSEDLAKVHNLMRLYRRAPKQDG